MTRPLSLLLASVLLLLLLQFVAVARAEEVTEKLSPKDAADPIFEGGEAGKPAETQGKPAHNLAVATGARLINHKGPKIREARVHLMTFGNVGSANINGVKNLLNKLQGTRYFGILRQYVGGPPRLNFVGPVLSNPGTTLPCVAETPEWGTSLASVPDVVDKICNNLASLETKDIVLILTTQRRPTNCLACSYHDYVDCAGSGKRVYYGVVFDGGRGGGDPFCHTNEVLQNWYKGSIPRVRKEPLASYIDHTTRILYGIMSNPEGDGWWNVNGELHKQCYWNFGQPVKLTPNGPFNLQKMYSNAARSCLSPSN